MKIERRRKNEAKNDDDVGGSSTRKNRTEKKTRDPSHGCHTQIAFIRTAHKGYQLQVDNSGPIGIGGIMCQLTS